MLVIRVWMFELPPLSIRQHGILSMGLEIRFFREGRRLYIRLFSGPLTLMTRPMAHFMQSRKLAVFLFSIALFITSTKPQEIISTDPSYYYNLCAPSTCNNLSLPYPFTFPTPCHVSTFQPHCPRNENLLVTSPGSTDIFRVLSINFSGNNSSFFLASDGLFSCGNHFTNPRYQNYAPYFSLPRTYTPGTLLNCTGPVPSDSVPGLQNASCIGCPGESPSNVCYYARDYVGAPPGCELYRMFTLEDPFNASAVQDMRGLLQQGFQLNYVKPSGCRECENSGGRCGSRPITASFVCFCPSSVHLANCSDGVPEDLSTWVNEPVRGGSRPSRAVVAAISASGSLMIIVIIVVLVLIFYHRRKNSVHFNKETISSISPTRYSYSQLKKITKNFSDKLGEGGFGNVFKGTILQSRVDVPVAVKVLKTSKQVKKQFMNEVGTIGCVHHQNLVSMLGYCVQGETHALVYGYMENGPLDKFIYNRKGIHGSENKDLRPKQMYNIALETARGILYLHQGCRNRILHCDIKPANVLLDSNFSAKVADFGLARMIDKDQSHVSLTGAQGTPGYAAPEMWMKIVGPVTEKSDVYSYGMLLLEMVGRRKNYDPEIEDSSQVYFPEWLYNKVERYNFPLVMTRDDDKAFGILEDEINRNTEDEEAVQRMCLVGLWCIQHTAANRPNMDKVVQMLEGHIEIGTPPRPFPENATRFHESQV